MTPIQITDSAHKRFAKLAADHNKEAIRIGVKSGGCSGFTYSIDFDDLSNLESGDQLIEYSDVKIIVDGVSLMYILGVTVDWKEDLMGAAFDFKNPVATAGCGCGTSFSV